MNRVLHQNVGGKQNILVMNDEAHHAYGQRRYALVKKVTDVEAVLTTAVASASSVVTYEASPSVVLKAAETPPAFGK